MARGLVYPAMSILRCRHNGVDSPSRTHKDYCESGMHLSLVPCIGNGNVLEGLFTLHGHAHTCLVFGHTDITLM